MPKTQSRFKSSTGTQAQPPVPDVNLKIGSRATIKSNHPLFPSVICTITAKPSPDAAIVELQSGNRERILLQYLEQLQQSDPNCLDLAENCTEQVVKDNLEQEPTQKHPHTNEVEVIEELTPDEERERHRLELKVERAFYEAGCALRELRDLRLYRSTHKTFEEYCGDRFGFARRRPYQLIDAVSVVDNLCTNSSHSDWDENLCTICTQILPTNEGQVRPLTKLQPEEQRSCWQKAVDLADGKVPTGKIVKGVVERMREKPLYKASDFCEVGDVFTLTRLEGSERKYNGYPCFAIELKHFTINVDVYDTTLAVKPENLKKIDSPDVYRQLPVTLQRIRQLRNKEQVDRGEEAVLAHLGRQMYLTDFEEKLLSFLEQEHGIKPN